MSVKTDEPAFEVYCARLERIEKKMASKGVEALLSADAERLKCILRWSVRLARELPESALRDRVVKIRDKAESYLLAYHALVKLRGADSGSLDRIRHAQRQLLDEHVAYTRMESELLATYPGQYVALHKGKVVAADENEEHVLRAAYDKCGYVPLYVRRVGEPLPTVIARSPRQDPSRVIGE